MLLEINNLFFSHTKDKPLFQNLNLRFEANKIIALAGESGCGKSTLLSLIYGLLDWESGDIIFDGTRLSGPKGNLVPGEAEMKFVAQNFDLMPYATVAENVGKFISNINLKQKKENVMELLEVVGLQEFAHVLPKYLSGGQQQRVAIARALSVLPKLLILDEPFSNLDFPRKIELRERLFRYVKQHHVSLIISTHELQDIMPWLDQIVILQDGRLIQNDNPEQTYRHPYNSYVAKLFGEVNIFTEEEITDFQLSKFSYYPKEIKITETGCNAEVIESRFAGNHYWNKVKVKNKVIVMFTDERLDGMVNISFV
ncbi:ABC transporter ATP-binding protein [Chryseobacterium indologenes]|uniref:sulfate/molybdate ABC transporter ATP-binding protein n=1 Tax=Chryseobacterium TaxID=59732 RepID=UPI0003E0866C|nr:MULTISPECIES: ABC transporter ATP-binding protein [Chryseobacterium]ATN04174.1 ABC transporter ATP-binding protein [Chryseobacterium indologenes]AYY83163.1 ABC transporter ATP-binding protein [Chryseobacterium indologenes]QIX80065.1 ABC transporter ATP-binding protein [Chryseobacterium indologenes]QPQ50346.1 ABC transporter ATP-binding protein [Chryseobacterium indologenes]UDQ53705.1 ABC transporter ATP-binding protein [Chryseobacterium indologenes]